MPSFANGMKPGMQLGLYLAVFANEGMKPEMQLGLYLAVFANEGMKRDGSCRACRA